MKRRGCTVEYARERNADLLRAIRKCFAQCRHISMPEICAKAVKMPASRFWVSPERACTVVAKLDAGRPLGAMRSTKREMFKEIHRRVCLLRQSMPSAPLSHLVEIVIHQPAPEFYLAPGTVYLLFYQTRKEL